MTTIGESGVTALPTLLALDAHAVLDGQRRGTSVQMDDTYFTGQRVALESVKDVPAVRRRRKIVAESAAVYDDVHIDFEAPTEPQLMEASRRFREILQALPEVQFLRESFPGTCLVVPEWLRTEDRVKYGARIYFMRDGEAPDPETIIRRNVDAVVTDSRPEFERYVGDLHGYPECCVESFMTHQRGRETAPEIESTGPLAEHVDEDALGSEEGVADRPIEDVVTDVFEAPDVYGFFTREFFPEPGCDVARRRGLAIYEALLDAFPERLVEDHFRFNVGWNYVLARSLGQPDGNRPTPGALGTQHCQFYLPLGPMLSHSRYGT